MSNGLTLGIVMQWQPSIGSVLLVVAILFVASAFCSVETFISSLV